MKPKTLILIFGILKRNITYKKNIPKITIVYICLICANKLKLQKIMVMMMISRSFLTRCVMDTAGKNALQCNCIEWNSQVVSDIILGRLPQDYKTD